MGLKDAEERNFIQSVATSHNFKSKYKSKCCDCRRKILIGDLIHKTDEGYAHAICNEVKRSEGAGFGRRTGATHLGKNGRYRHKP